MSKIVKDRRKSQFRYLENGVLELRRAAKIKPRKIEPSGFFLLDHNRETRVFRLVWGTPDVWLLKNWDSPTEEEDAPPCVN